MSSFKWKKGEVFLLPPTGRTKAYHNFLKSVSGFYDLDSHVERSILNQTLWLLSRVDKVTGNIGFPVPNGDANKENVLAFHEALMNETDELFSLWDSTALMTTIGDNDPTLLPPSKVTDDDKKNTAKQGDNKE